MKLDKGIFRTAYLMAMTQQAPKMYRELKEEASLDLWLDGIVVEAEELFKHALENIRLRDGSLNEASASMAREVVYHEMVKFPESIEA